MIEDCERVVSRDGSLIDAARGDGRLRQEEMNRNECQAGCMCSHPDQIDAGWSRGSEDRQATGIVGTSIYRAEEVLWRGIFCVQQHKLTIEAGPDSQAV